MGKGEKDFFLKMKRVATLFLFGCGFFQMAFGGVGRWVKLSDGADLAGWQGGAGATEVAGYVLADGVITTGPGGGNLVTEKEYADYILEFEFKLTPGANNGLGIHYPGEGDPAHTGMELQILDDGVGLGGDQLRDSQRHGSLYLLAAAKRGYLKPVGEWNSQRVTVRGARVSVELNGVAILHEDLDELAQRHPEHEGLKRRKGYLAFCGHGDVVSWRGVRIVEIPFGAPMEAERFQPAGKKESFSAELGFRDLLAEGNLSQWQMTGGHEGHWTVKEGWILAYDGQSEAEDPNLWSRESFRDFELFCDWRFVSKGPQEEQPIVLPNGLEMRGDHYEVLTTSVDAMDSGLYLRGSTRTQVNIWNWPVGSGEVYGVRKSPVGLPYKAAVTPRLRADRPSGEWNRFCIRMVGDELTVILNGETVVYEAVLPPVEKGGPLALQHNGWAIEFANLWIRDL